MYCGYCGAEHRDPDQVCEICTGCYNLCPKDLGHKWVDTKRASEQNISKQKTNEEKQKQGEENTDIKEKFKLWLSNSLIVKDISKQKLEDLWLDFETILKEKLSKVDDTKKYILINKIDDKNATVEYLNTENLFINQDKEYIYFSCDRRKNLGKKVAIMEDM